MLLPTRGLYFSSMQFHRSAAHLTSCDLFAALYNASSLIAISTPILVQFDLFEVVMIINGMHLLRWSENLPSVTCGSG